MSFFYAWKGNHIFKKTNISKKNISKATDKSKQVHECNKLFFFLFVLLIRAISIDNGFFCVQSKKKIQ